MGRAYIRSRSGQPRSHGNG